MASRPLTQCLIVMVKGPGVDVYVPAIQEACWNQYVTCYFDRGLINAVTDQFPLVKIIGCMIHWKQALRRKTIELQIPQDKIATALTPGVLDILTVILVD
ncbi:hypothetical protein PF005_g11049 [Phytophthora fragariae]|uniref:MULE transposase domain-containing protein n=2 Tax=Phytophthora fragariae TaxID=53985 RepID=A0A6A3Y3L3_9STRA|nr:hypothetical protein PF003_g32072 [Phytophthora fragariae]KAE8938151.1 hypothetical protein PF009_g11954 [Phytophthora fragariae]KAE8999203.1 hypothetical protein PF011_g14728 [Phytophthora fragariae]KAE9211314.1 hypothetical protein PF005_g11049 [Phytophthora fragariae]KAE9233907.1 hypothetical protein PF004_g9530 [Phytophthora fragariae]